LRAAYRHPRADANRRRGGRLERERHGGAAVVNVVLREVEVGFLGAAEAGEYKDAREPREQRADADAGSQRAGEAENCAGAVDGVVDRRTWEPYTAHLLEEHRERAGLQHQSSLLLLLLLRCCC
jgi:hypothetical protein